MTDKLLCNSDCSVVCLDVAIGGQKAEDTTSTERLLVALHYDADEDDAIHTGLDRRADDLWPGDV